MVKNNTLFIGLATTLLINFVLIACKQVSPVEYPPSFIAIDSVVVNNEDIPSAVPDVWLSENVLPLGVFELPAKAPVLSSGRQRIIIRAGIVIDGIRSTRTPYPFLADIDTVLELSPQKIAHFTPRFRLITAVKRPFPIQESFEGSALIVQAGGNAVLTREVEANGNGYGRLEVPPNNEGELLAIDGLELPQNETPIYLEMNYQCSIDFIVGLRFETNGQTREWHEVRLRPAQTWQKVYINLTQEANAAPANSQNFRIFCLTRSSDRVETVLFDNIRLLHFR